MLAPGGYDIDGFSSFAREINAYGKADIEIPAELMRMNDTTPQYLWFYAWFFGSEICC